MGHQKAEKQVVKAIKCIYPEPGILILSGVLFDFYLINLFQTVLGQRTTISSLPPTPAVSNSRTVGFSIFDFCARVSGEYLFINTSQACGEQFAHRRFFYFWLLCPRFKRVSFFQRIPAADCRRQTAHSLLWVRFVFVPALKTPIFTVLFS